MSVWPQLIYLALVVIGLTLAAVNHGRPREEYHFGLSLFAAVAILGILYWGGFFDPLLSK